MVVDSHVTGLGADSFGRLWSKECGFRRCFSPGQSQQNRRLGREKWYPFVWLDGYQDQPDPSFDIDIAKELSHRIYGKDVKIDLVPVTSNTRLPLLKNGNVDALIATMTITPERQKQVDFSDVYFDAGQAILVKKGSPIKSVKDLKAGTKVIGVQGSNSVDNVKKAAPDTRVLQLADYAQAFTALKSGQGDALTTDNGILYGMSSDDPNYVVVGGTFTNEPYGIAVNKGQKPFLKAINKNLKAMRQDGTYHKIEQKWFGKIQGFHQGR